MGVLVFKKPTRRSRRGRVNLGVDAAGCIDLLEEIDDGDIFLDGEPITVPSLNPRVAIARAMLTRPRALLLDEVTSALGPELVGEVLEVIRELKEQGMTMILATHEMSFARDVADQACFLEGGRIIEQGPPEQIFSAPREAATQRFLSGLIEANRI